MSIAGDSRVSPVSALKAKPSTAIFLLLIVLNLAQHPLRVNGRRRRAARSLRLWPCLVGQRSGTHIVSTICFPNRCF